MYVIFVNLDWTRIAESSLSSLVVALIIGGFTYLFKDKLLEQMRVSQEIKSYGFKGIAAMNTHSTREIMDLCENAERLDLLFISGSQFFSNNEYILKLAMDRGTKIRFLCSQVYTPFLSDLEKLEIKKKLRKPGTNISSGIEDITKRYSKYIKEGKMEIRYYSTEYRLPFMLVYKDEKNVKITKAFLRVTLPPYNWKTNFALIGERETLKKLEDFKTNKNEVDFISMMEDHFDCIWEVADKKIRKNSKIKKSIGICKNPILRTLCKKMK